MNKDGAWNDEEFASFYRTVNGENPDESTLTFIRTRLPHNEHGMTFPALLALYTQQTITDINETERDMKILGF